ncbi:hypothetical protein AB0H92_10905 [Streptomyces phaeochromogenes]|uniref:hypothetical protein n=1 Tax=Streptomyces phaeochromogenes TaxID=1923 RepID=UPI0033CC9FFB
MRTMLPPNLTRNYYEVKRLIAEGEGKELPYWYQLTDEQKRAEELDVELLRRAICRAEEEQDLVANFNPPATEQPAAAAAAPCGCYGCSNVRALAHFFARARQNAQRASGFGWDVGSNGDGVTVYAFRPGALTAEEFADLDKRAREAVDRWGAAGTPVGPLTESGAAKAAYVLAFPPPVLTGDYLDRLMKRLIREPYLPSPAAFVRPPAPMSFLRDVL